MKLSRRALDRLTFLNSLLLVLILAGAVLGAVFLLTRGKVRSYIRAFTEQQLRQSEAVGPWLADGETEPLPTFEIGIQPRYMREIQELTQRVAENRALTEEHKIYFPARFYVDDREYRGRIRLRGDLSAHWRGAKKSWRFNFDRETPFAGYDELDLIIPRDKAYQVELLSYEVARELGLIAPDAGFANVRINSVDMGTYFWREPPGKVALERLQYPEGEIFAERNTWLQEFYSGYGLYEIPSPAISFFPGNFKLRVRRDASGGWAAERWNRLLGLIVQADDEEFERDVEGLVDLDKYLAWNALTWLFGSVHSHWGDNLDWYYDNTTGLFEPLLYDVFRYELETRGTGTWEWEEHDDLALKLLRDPQRRQRRNEILWRLATDDQFDLARRSGEMLARYGDHFYRGVDAAPAAELRSFHLETFEILDGNRELIRGNLEFARVFSAATVTVADDGVPALEVRLVPDALVRLDLERLDLLGDWSPELDLSTIELSLTDPAGRQRRIETAAVRRDDRLELAPSEVELWTPMDERLRPQMGEYRLALRLPGLGPSQWRRPGALAGLELAVRNSISGAELPATHLLQAPLAYRFDGDALIAGTVEDLMAGGDLPLTLSGDTLVLGPGTFELERDLVLPRGLDLRLAPGTRLLMGPQVSLIAYGALHAAGTREQPIEIAAQRDGRPWGGLGIISAERRSTVAHFTVSGGSEDHLNGIYLSGQLCFYSSDVDLTDCRIERAAADDGLNIKRASFRIERCRFENNLADAFDGDWVRGVVTQSVFVDNGGDGLDLSGSEALALDNLFQRQGDKGLSIGERTDFTGFNNLVRDSVIGMAIKDLSTAHDVASVYYGNETAVALYRKKALFGGATGRITGSLLWGNSTDFSLDGESALRLEGVGREDDGDPSGVTSSGNLIGDPAASFRIDDAWRFEFVGGDDSPFASGVNLDALTVLDESLPPLAGGPAGLARPLPPLP